MIRTAVRHHYDFEFVLSPGLEPWSPACKASLLTTTPTAPTKYIQTHQGNVGLIIHNAIQHFKSLQYTHRIQKFICLHLFIELFREDFSSFARANPDDLHIYTYCHHVLLTRILLAEMDKVNTNYGHPISQNVR